MQDAVQRGVEAAIDHYVFMALVVLFLIQVVDGISERWGNAAHKRRLRKAANRREWKQAVSSAIQRARDDFDEFWPSLFLIYYLFLFRNRRCQLLLLAASFLLYYSAGEAALAWLLGIVFGVLVVLLSAAMLTIGLRPVMRFASRRRDRKAELQEIALRQEPSLSSSATLEATRRMFTTMAHEAQTKTPPPEPCLYNARRKSR